MKKYLVISIFTLVGYVSLGAQSPVFSYGNHSMSTIKTFSRSGTALAKSWNTQLTEYVQEKMDDAGKNITVTPSFILNHTVIEERQIKKKFLNSSRSGNRVNMDTRYSYDFEGFVGVFSYDNVDVIVFKQNCLNLLQVFEKPTPPQPKQDTVIVVEKQVIQTCTIQVSVIVDVYYDAAGNVTSTVDRPLNINNLNGCKIEYLTPTVIPHYAQAVPQPPAVKTSSFNLSLNFDFGFYENLGIRGNSQQCRQQYQERCYRDRSYDQRCRQQYQDWCRNKPVYRPQPSREYHGSGSGGRPSREYHGSGSAGRFDSNDHGRGSAGGGRGN